MHFPETIESITRARRRIGFEEIFTMAMASELNRADFAREKAQHIIFQESAVVAFVKSLPYELTDDQRKSTWQILQDMTKGSPMNRLLLGDVGSGKTAVATIAMMNACVDGFQSAFMAPTELLASQHAQTIISILPDELKNQVVFLSGGMTKKQKEVARQAIESGVGKIIIGTHALIQDSVKFNHLGLVVIDEQHRFGVEQRKMLQAKAKFMPHVLHMTATPIPRSIALTLYGDLDISLLKSKPKSRLPIETKIFMPDAREHVYKKLEAEIDSGRQVFVVCPMIEEGDKKGERELSVGSIAKHITAWLPGKNIAVLHGKMKSEEKEATMSEFKEGKTNILVSTTVVEVGVDVPNATVMVIEGADRFGLAQLHQLRGRIGRGEHAGTCILITVANEPPTKRLRVIEHEYDGFKLADYDLELRGPGAIYGTTQHGALDLRVAKITDVELIAEARAAARSFMKKGENLVQYTQLKARVDRLRTITNLN
jgi:ATP-dependent DNA helicase RecG